MIHKEKTNGMILLTLLIEVTLELEFHVFNDGLAIIQA